jgi:hypothetical protein
LDKGLSPTGRRGEEPVAGWEVVVDRQDEITPDYGFVQCEVELKKAGSRGA